MSIKNRGNQHPNWKGVGDLSSEYFAGVIKGAKNRKIEFNITIEEAWDQFIKQNSKCALTDLPLKFGLRTFIRRGEDEQTASLDRIDSSKGYLIDNIQWIHKDINLMKGDMSQQEFIDLCKQIVKYNHL